MGKYSLSHVSDAALARDLAAAVAGDRASTAILLAHIAEFDARKLYVPAAHPSMYSYCVHELKLSEEAAFKRIHAARAARRFPAIFGAVADGRLHLSAVVMLALHLTPENGAELLTAATHRSKAEIEKLLAERSPRPDLPEQVVPMSALQPALVMAAQHTLGRVEPPASERAEEHAPQTCAPLAAALCAPAHGRSGDLRPAPSGPGPARASAQLQRHCPGSHPCAQAAGAASRAAQVRCDGPASQAWSLVFEPPPYPRRGEARGPGAGSGPVHVPERQRPALSGAHETRVRSHRAGGLRGPGHRGRHAAQVQGAQSVRRGVHVWRRVHGPQATAGAGGRGRRKAQTGRRRGDPLSQSTRFSRR